MKLSIIIPAYNEEKRISKTLKEYYNFFQSKLKDEFEIIIIVNNSKDKTFDICEEFSKNKKMFKVINIPYYVGKGGAVMKGFEKAKGDLIGFTDADNSTNPENFFKLYQEIKSHHGIIASRRKKGALIEPKRRFSQQASSLAFNFLVQLLFNLNFKDTQCGAKIFTKNVAKFLSENYKEEGWAFDVDILFLCKRKKLKIVEHPIYWKDAEGSSLNLKDSVKSVLRLFKIRFRKFNFS